MGAEKRGGPAAEGELRAAPIDLRAVREVLHDALHELAAINTLAAAVEAEGSCSEEAVGYLRRIQGQTVAVAGVLREVFLSRLEDSPVDVGQLLDELALSAPGSVRTTVRIDDSAPRYVLTNQMRLRRVLRNLIDNAVRAAEPDGVVELSFSSTRDGLVLSVDDSGPGFGDAPGGLASLGLQIVSRLVEETGGELAVKESRLGGACVEVLLPSLLLVESGGRLDDDEWPVTS